jgi:hypothetical protein
MKRYLTCLALLLFVISLGMSLPLPCTADTLTLNDGQTLKGTFNGISGGKIQFNAFGNDMEFPVGKVVTLTMEGKAPTPAAQPAKAAPAPAAPAAVSAGGPVTIPAGTGLLVKMQTAVVTGKVKSGDPFIAVVEKPITIDGKTVVRKGAKAYGRVVEAVAARRVAGQAKLIIQIVEVETKSGIVSINTQSHEFQGAKSGTLRKVAVGAAIGNIDNDNNRKKGAQEGAAIGGAIAVMSPGNQIAINPGVLMEFRLLAPVKVD